VLFSGHLLCFEHFLFCCRRTSPKPGVENVWLARAVKKWWETPDFSGFGRN